ncbi:MAG TPA: SusC/RagA family TonB-linked outer membrane protein [Longimicrobium sp.]|nr:SusC/RagA family TonB-linked outer membrane protein [Longimicrobium sp.]
MSLIAALFAGGPLYAQGAQISGTVTSAEGARPLPGATVSIGAQYRTVTGPDGRYTLSVAPGTHRVSAGVIGHATVTLATTVAAGGNATLDFSLPPEALALQGLVAIGYGEVQVRDRTGVVEAVTSDEFNTGRVVSPEQLIQGKVPGVQVIDSGEPGGGINLRVRGGTSVTSSNEPLFVVDGVPLAVGGGISSGRNPLNFLNPSDIESFTVLKDAASTAIYGSRGANGVILIKTKSGSRSGPRLVYEGSASTSRVTGEPDLLNAAQYRAAVQQYAPQNLALLGNASTDWRDAVQRDGTGQEQTLALSGARDATSYRLSVGYLDQQGVVRGSSTERISASLNYADRFFGDRLNVRAHVRGARTDDSFTPGGVLGAANAFAPTQPVRAPSGDWYEYSDALGPNNPLAELAMVSEQGRAYRGVGNLEAEYRLPFLPDLRATVRAGFDVTDAERKNFYPRALRAQVENSTFGTVNRSVPSQTSTVFDAFANYKRALDGIDSDIDVTAGYSFETVDADSSFFQAQGLDSDLLGPNGIPGSELERTYVLVRESRLASFFARVNYSLKDRYLLTLSMRRDGSSRFGPANQWGTFPAAAVAWRLSDEPFMERFGAISDLKLRASWGVNGNQTFRDYLWVVSYRGANGQAQVQFGDDFVNPIRPSAVDPDIKWEETTSYNLGFDYGLFDNRVTGSLEYYVKDTDDLIFEVPVAAGTNLSNYVTTNIGSVRNRGLELSVNADVVDRGGFRWNVNFNASTNRNRLLQINPVAGGSESILAGQISGGVGNLIQVLRPGVPVYSFYVYRHKRGADGKPLYADENNDGVINEQDLYEDLDGNHVINQDDRAPFHSPASTWSFGHTSSLGYRNFDLGFTLRAQLGNYVYNNVASNQGYYDAVKGNAPTNLHASVLKNGFVSPQYFSDVYVEDASYLRMDNLTLGYTFDGLRQVDDLRLYGTVQNVFTLTGYSGVDPLSGLNGIDNNIYPRSRTFSLGVSLGF